MFLPLVAASVAVPVSLQEPVALEPASLHPSSATLVVQAPDIQAAVEAFRTTGAATLMSDPELHASVGQLIGGEGAEPMDPWELAMGRYQQAVETEGLPPFLKYLYGMKSMSFSLDVAGSDVLAFIQGAEAAKDGDFYLSQNLGLRLVVDFTDESLVEEVTQLLVEMINEESGGDLQLSAKALTMPDTAMGFGSTAVQAWSFVPSQAGSGADPSALESSLHLIAGGTRVAFSTGNVELGDFINALSSGSMPSSATSLFTEGRATFTKAAETPVFEAYLRPFIEEIVLAEEPAALPLLDVAELLIGQGASFAIRGGHWRMGIDGGQFLTQGLHEPSTGRPMSGMVGAEPLNSEALGLVHPNALVTSVTSLNPAVLTKAIGVLAEDLGDDALVALDENYGFRPDRDLAGSLGSALSYSLPKITSLISPPNLMVAALLKDKVSFTNGMDGLVRLAQDYVGDDFLFVRDEYKGNLLYTLSYIGELDLPIGDLPFDPAQIFKPTATILDDRVVLMTTYGYAKAEIRRLAKLAKKGEVPPVHGMIKQMGDLDGATTVGYSDWPNFLGSFYGQLRAMAPLLGAAAGGALPFDVKMLPEPDVLSRHFLPSENWTRMKDGKVLQYAKSSLGLEALIMPLMTFGLYGTSSEMRGSQEVQVVATTDETEVDALELTVREMASSLTEASVMRVDVAVTLYQLDHKGAPPASLADLSLKTENYPNGYLDGAALPLDGWDRALVYRTVDGGYKLYSMGPNGEDDDGGGDDISSQ